MLKTFYSADPVFLAGMMILFSPALAAYCTRL